MYKNIDKHKATLDYYFERLSNEGLTNADAFAQMKEQINASLNQSFEASKSYKPKATDWLESKWKDFKSTCLDPTTILSKSRAVVLTDLTTRPQANCSH